MLNLGAELQKGGHWDESIELFKRSIDYCKAALQRRPHDTEFAGDLGAAYGSAARTCWARERREEALGLCVDMVSHYRQLAAANPDVPAYLHGLWEAIYVHASYLGQAGQSEAAKAMFRGLAESIEASPDQNSSLLGLQYAALARVRVAELLLGGNAARTPRPGQRPRGKRRT